MEESFSIFVVILLLLVMDSFVLAREGNAVFFKYFGKYNFIYLSEDKNKHSFELILLNLIPPLGEHFLIESKPFYLGYNKFLINNRSLSKNIIHDWGEINKLVYLNGDFLFKNKTIRMKSNLTYFSRILKMERCGLGERESLEKITRYSFNNRFLVKKLFIINKVRDEIRPYCIFLWFFLLIYVPIMIHYFGIVNVWLILVVFTYGITITITIKYRILHKKLYKENRYERLVTAIRMLLCPPSAIRACDCLTKTYLEIFNPVNIASIVLKKAEFNVFAKNYLKDFYYPIHNYAENEIEFQVFLTDKLFSKKCIEEFLINHGAEASQFLPTVGISENGAINYCPRCHCQFNVLHKNCPDCSGVKLVKF